MDINLTVQNEITKAQSFILGGRSEFSIENLATERAYRYKVSQSKDNLNIYFVRTYVKSNDFDGWVYAGFLDTTGNGKYIKGNKGRLDSTSPQIKGLLYALRNGDNPLPRPMTMYHHGRCACCGKKLMDLDSVTRGFGPVCWQKVGGVA